MECLATTPFDITLDEIDNFSKKKKHKRKKQKHFEDTDQNQVVSSDEHCSKPKKRKKHKKVDVDIDDGLKLSSVIEKKGKEHTKITKGLAKLLENFGDSDSSLTSPETKISKWNVDDEIHTPVKKRKKVHIDFSLLSGSNTSGGKVILNSYNITVNEDKTQSSTEDSAQACTPLKKVKKKLTKYYNGSFSPLSNIHKSSLNLNINASEERNAVTTANNNIHREAIDKLKKNKNTSLDSNTSKHLKDEKQCTQENTNRICEITQPSDSEMKSRKRKKKVSVECELKSGDLTDMHVPVNKKKDSTTHNNLIANKEAVKMNRESSKHSLENKNQHSVSDPTAEIIDHNNRSEGTKPENDIENGIQHSLHLSIPKNGTRNETNEIMEPYKERKRKKSEKKIISIKLELENQEDLMDIEKPMNEHTKYNNLNINKEQDVDIPRKLKDESNTNSREIDNQNSKSTQNDSVTDTTDKIIDPYKRKSTKSKKRKHLTNGMNKVTDPYDSDKTNRKAEKMKISAEHELESNSSKQYDLDMPVKLKKKSKRDNKHKHSQEGKDQYYVSDSTNNIHTDFDTSGTCENIQEHAKMTKKKVTVKCEPDSRIINPDYIDMMDILDCSSRRISDEHKEMLQNLIVTNPWPVPPSHLIETRMSTHPSKLQQMMFKEQGFNMIIDHYTSAEDNTIIDNWNQFCELHKIPNDPEPFLAFEASRDTKAEGSVLPKTQRIDFVRFLGHNLPNRCLFSIYKRFKKLFSERRKGRFTTQEDNAILNFVKNSNDSNKFAQLAVILHRDRHAIMLRYKVLMRASKNNLENSSHNGVDDTSL